MAEARPRAPRVLLVDDDAENLVLLSEVLTSEGYRRPQAYLKFALGADVNGNPVGADLTRMPHLLVAGATGSGKSVYLNVLVTSLLFGKGPDELRFLMIDPKMIELTSYNGIPHLLMPVVTDAKKAAKSLRWAEASIHTAPWRLGDSRANRPPGGGRLTPSSDISRP